MLGCKGLSDITTNVPIAKMNIDIKCAVLKNSIPGGGVSWMLFCAHHPTGKIFLELEVHHMAGRLLSLHVIMLSISTWKKNSLGILVTVAAQMEEGSLGFTASSFKPFVNPCGLGKLSDWRRGTILKHHIKYKLIARFQYFHIWFLYDKLNYAGILSSFFSWSIGGQMHRRHLHQQNFSFSSYKTNRFHVAMDLYSNRSGTKYIMYYILVLTTFWCHWGLEFSNSALWYHNEKRLRFLCTNHFQAVQTISSLNITSKKFRVNNHCWC